MQPTGFLAQTIMCKANAVYKEGAPHTAHSDICHSASFPATASSLNKHDNKQQPHPYSGNKKIGIARSAQCRLEQMSRNSRSV